MAPFDWFFGCFGNCGFGSEVRTNSLRTITRGPYTQAILHLFFLWKRERVPPHCDPPKWMCNPCPRVWLKVPISFVHVSLRHGTPQTLWKWCVCNPHQKPSKTIIPPKIVKNINKTKQSNNFSGVFGRQSMNIPPRKEKMRDLRSISKSIISFHFWRSRHKTPAPLIWVHYGWCSPHALLYLGYILQVGGH